MKKIFLGMSFGLIFGIGLALTASVYADDIKTEVKNLIGYEVQGTFPIKLQDSQLETNAIVVDNMSYLPVRTIGELLNVDVSFIDNTVLLKAKDGAVNSDKLKEYEKVSTDKQGQWEKDRQASFDKIKAEENSSAAAKQKILDDLEKSNAEYQKKREKDEQQQTGQPQSTPTK